MPDTPGETPAGGETPSTTAEEPFDKDRAMATINNLRGFEKTAKAQEKQIAELTQKLTAYENEKLTEQQRLQKSAQEAAERASSLEAQLKADRMTLAIEREARKLNIIDPEMAALAIQSKVSYDAEGKPENVGDLLTQLVKDKPFLVGQSQQPQQPATPPGAGGSSTNPSRDGGAQTRTFSQAQLRDTKFYNENRTEIMQAMREGRITD